MAYTHIYYILWDSPYTSIALSNYVGTLRGWAGR